MGLLDRDLKSGDIIRIERVTTKEHAFNIVYSHGLFQIEFQELAKLFIKAFGKAIYCSSIYADGQEHQLYKLSEDDFWDLVKNRIFIVYIDSNVYTLKDYPEYNVCDDIKNILKTELYDPALTSDSRFIQSQCLQFEQIPNITAENL